jgi:DNA-binding NarL/FixJ family response regulator
MDRPSRARQAGDRRRIFIVDDHPIVRDGLRGVIEQEPDLMVCGEAAEAAQALAAVDASCPDLVIIDLSLGQSSGLELLKDLAIRHPRLPALVLSMHDELLYANRALRAGARGYLMKDEGSESLLAAVRRILAGKVFVSENIMTEIVSNLGQSKQRLQPIERLSDRELEVFQLLGQGMSTADIADRMHISLKTVQAYVARAKEKFSVETMHDLLREAIRWQEAMVRAAT